MFLYNFKYELKSLLRSKWLFLLSTILLIVMLFAGYNGKQKVNKRIEDFSKITAQTEERDAVMLHVLDSLEKGLEVNMSNNLLPNNPMNVGYRYPKVAALQPKPLTFISVGQSDLFTHTVQPKIYGDNFSYNYSELSSPVQLLFGSFDIAFVIIYILPLIIIAFSYNILSKEKEYGSIKLLASQPISIYSWLLQKVTFRFFWLTLITSVVLLITFIINGFDFGDNMGAFLSLIMITTAYILFWFAIVLAINIFIGNSAKNAVSLLGIWVFVILIIPATVSQLANLAYPIPSRTKMLAEVRNVKKEIAEKQDKILDNYLRDHPEYASTGKEINYSFWHRYIASQNLAEAELKPLLASYTEQIENQQSWIENWQYISPAVIVQQSFNNLAGTSSAHYQEYKKQVVAFSVKWKDFFTPLLYKSQPFRKKMYKNLPMFEYQQPKIASMTFNAFIILFFSALILTFSWLFFNKKSEKGTLIN
ncbi:DUF3526 domain-containing protein [Polaribacter sargassicola]|uniref:DUF3526 domain-containing protein n=1 Tax=Polaribacter sargassicola TaxID=2836891 RepID=UPI001F3FDE10|nr:DUF3526 domain-containing protein [Polaribacter sp. DS7-9]MCG1037573.1 ABC transporter permease [Polaribacter sp. DS7-9]